LLAAAPAVPIVAAGLVLCSNCSSKWVCGADVCRLLFGAGCPLATRLISAWNQLSSSHARLEAPTTASDTFSCQ
jgi:hypothetical protein